MDLYCSPMSCSFTAHVACLEAGLPVTLHLVDRRSKRLDDGRDYRAIAPQGIVPAISLEDGGVLTESVAVLQWIGDHAARKDLLPAWGTPERYRAIEWLNFVTTELHKKHAWPIFSSKTGPALKDFSRENVGPALDHVERRLSQSAYLLGDTFTVPDIYLFWVLYVLPHGGVALDRWPSISAYVERIANRPSVKKALSIEGPLFLEEKARMEQSQSAG